MAYLGHHYPFLPYHNATVVTMCTEFVPCFLVKDRIYDVFVKKATKGWNLEHLSWLRAKNWLNMKVLKELCSGVEVNKFVLNYLVLFYVIRR